MGSTLIIPVRSRGDVVGVSLIDECDRDLLELDWHPHGDGYVCRWRSSGCVFLHRVIMDPPEHLFVDHINGIRFDNRRRNLRVVDRAVNQGNLHRRSRNELGLRGVYRCGDRWRAAVQHRGTREFRGYFDDAGSANEAVVARRRELGLQRAGATT